MRTTHSVAAEVTELENEADATAFTHELSGNRYEVSREGGQLIHREIMQGLQGQQRLATEAAIALSVGSGTHGKSYLFRDGEFWAQSPLTWFRETANWGMSPGYDRPFHLSFRRKVRTGCVFCHVGSIDQKEGNPFCFEIVEATIGCERCHGPGELHVDKHHANPSGVGHSQTDDDTIVNPAKLSRELSEAVCQQCHLQALTKASVSGKGEWDYRPGLPLTDFRVDYQYRLGDDTMKIVGHVEQMHASECYQQTETMTCVTCHNPHDPPPAGADAAVIREHYRSICLDCHQDDACGEAHDRRMEVAQNDCAQCHMPKAKTNVPHTAFRQHRIGVYSKRASETQRKVVDGLSPVLKLNQLSEQERKRVTSMAKAMAYRADPANPKFATYGVEATGELLQLKQAGVNDPELNAILAWLARDQGQREIAQLLCKEVLIHESRPKNSRIEAISLLAQDAFERRDASEAVRYFRELTGFQRDAYDSYYLGLAENNSGNVDAAIKALVRSLEIDPSQEAAHVALQAIYQAKGDLVKSQYHAEQAIANRQSTAQKQSRLKKRNQAQD
ncbi:MAG: hypothetical protein AB8B91_20955 [Rubripirellula sp.]